MLVSSSDIENLRSVRLLTPNIGVLDWQWGHPTNCVAGTLFRLKLRLNTSTESSLVVPSWAEKRSFRKRKWLSYWIVEWNVCLRLTFHISVSTSFYLARSVCPISSVLQASRSDLIFVKGWPLRGRHSSSTTR
jgi:hypothetical protein